MEREKRIVLCLDEQSLAEPAMVGLAGEALPSLPWLACVTSAEACRAAVRGFSKVEEAWVVSCADMEPINVAAALKRDDPDKRVYLVEGRQNGSLASRAACARVDGVWSEADFVKRYAQAKRAFSSDALAAQSAEVFSRGRNHGRNASKRVEPSLGEAEGGVVIAVVSGSGGSGKSTLAALLGFIAAKSGFSTAIVDADLQFGDVARLLGAQEPLRIDDAIDDPSRMGKLRDGAGSVPALLAPPSRIETAELVVQELPRILSAMKSDYDIVVVNTGALWSEVQASVLERSDAVAFVVDSRPSSLAASVHAVELCSRLGIATGGFTFVVNRHERSSLLSGVDVSCAFRGAHAVELPHGGREVDELLGAGYPGELLEAKNPLVGAICELLREFLPEEKRDEIALGSFGASKRRWFARRRNHDAS